MKIRRRLLAATTLCLLLTACATSASSQDFDATAPVDVEVKATAGEQGQQPLLTERVDENVDGDEADRSAQKAKPPGNAQAHSIAGNGDGEEPEANEESKVASEPKNITIDGISAVAALVIAAFAVDRFATGFLFFLSLLPAFRRWCPEPGTARVESLAKKADQAETSLVQPMGERLNRVVYFIFAAIGAGLVAWIGDIGILEVLGFKRARIDDVHHHYDFLLTVLILTAGADRVAALLQLSGASVGGGGESKPIEITGTLTIDGKKEDFNATIETASEGSDG